jgi:glycosyltransferase involved in cell wall biosynthesis
MHGVPVLTMRTSSAETLVQHGTGGLLADDLSAFARNLLALAADEELRRSMSSAARAYAHENLTTERWVRRVVDLLGTHN